MRLIALLFLIILSFTLRAENINVTFVVPDTHGSDFWNLVNEVNIAAAKDLNINFEIIHSDADRFAHVSAIRDIISRKKKPDYLIFRGFLGNISKLFDLLEENKIKFITLEQEFTGEYLQEVSTPQDKYKYWLGQINYDNKASGQLLLDALISQHFILYPDKKMLITGIGGNASNQSLMRQSALDNFITEKYQNKVVINQVFLSNWRMEYLTERFSAIQKRYPETTAYWCAGDQLALTVLKERSKLNSSPIIIGGFDWLPEILRKIKTGEVTASVGGHFLMVANAMVKIIDYQNGINRFVLPPLMSHHELITQENVDLYLHSIENKIWQQVNFNNFVFSKSKNPLELNVNNIIKLHQKSNKSH